VEPDVTFTCEGNIIASGTITLAAGAVLAMDTSSPSEIQLTPGSTMAHLQVNGTASQHCLVRAIGACHTRITDNWQSGSGRVVATFCDFQRLGGDPDWRALQYKLSGSGEPCSFTDCTFNQCSQIKHDGHFEVPAGAYVEFIRCVWTNSVKKTNLGQWEEWDIVETWSNYGTTFKLIHCDFDKRVGLHLPKDLEIEDCIFREGVHSYGGEWWGGIYKSFKRNFIRGNDDQGYFVIGYGNTIEDCIIIIDDQAGTGWNPHYGAISEGTGPVYIKGCIWWWSGSSPIAEGDGFFIDPASSGTRADNEITFERNIFLPNALGPNGANNLTCTGFTILNTSTNKQVVFKKNTVFTGSGSGGLNLGETNPSTAGDMALVKSNLFVGGSTSTGLKMNNLGHCETDVFLAENVDYNASYRIADGAMYGNGSGKGYGAFTFSGSNVVGEHDVDDVNPLFVDPFRTPTTWAGSLDATMDRLSPGGGYAMSDLLFYLREGFRPQNAALVDAGDPADGSPDIGAVDITTIANIPPMVSITSPATGSTFTAPANITITADASDSDGSITKVEFFESSDKIGEDFTSPFSLTWNNVPGGSYILTALATDDNGDTTGSDPVYILVQDFTLTKITNDLGDSDDFLTTSQIYLERYGWEGNYNIPGDDADFIHQETADSFWVFTTAPVQQDLIKSRTIQMTTNAEFYASAIGQGNTVYLGIRYKDNLPDYYGATPVYSYNGSDWVEIGSLGGDFDHQWKVEVIAVSPSDVSIANNRYRFKIGEGIWSRGLKGFLSIDRIELATSAAELTVEADRPGFYPAADDGNFTGLHKDSPWYDENGDPFFPIGFAAGWTGMSESLFQKVADGGFNTLVFYNWMDISDPYAAGDVWDVLPSAGHYGFSEFLDECEQRNLKTIGVFQNDIKYFVVQNYYGSEHNCLEYIKSSVARNKNHPALLAWSPVDEPDHSSLPKFYAPAEWCMSIKNAIREADPDHPIYALEMGWRAGAFGHFKDICDYQGHDVYPDFGESISLIGERADQLVAETGGEKPFITYLKAYDRESSQAFMSLAEAYLAVIHGANGIFYWDLGSSDPIWSTLTQIAGEVNVLNHVLLPPAATLDVNGDNGLCVANSAQIENAYKRGADNNGYIIAVNTENSAANGVQFTVAGLEAGTEINVLFESSTITSAAGTFTDDFGAYGRRVYKYHPLRSFLKRLPKAGT